MYLKFVYFFIFDYIIYSFIKNIYSIIYNCGCMEKFFSWYF